MQQLLHLWTALSLTKKAVVVAACTGMFFAVMALARVVTAPTMALLYSGLDPSAASQVVQALEQKNVLHEVRGNAIFVPAVERDSLRLGLAGDGLPTNGGSGYELLDNLSGFGTTSQMFDAAYWRAKEGELARTIASSPHINSARVHIARADSNPFRQGESPTASVAVGTPGSNLSDSQARALRSLVASAVAGLSPDDVAIIGSDGVLVSDRSAQDGAASEEARSEQLRRKVERLLEARVGLGNAIVEVSVETVTEREAIRERTFDPQTRVAISTDTEEITLASNQQSPGQVSVASNLPDGDAQAGGGSNSQNSETRERINYEVSEVEREVVREPGSIKKLSVAVLVNGVETSTESGDTVIGPRSDEEMDALKELVASTVGLDEERGDTITIKSMSLLAIAPQGTEVSSSIWTLLELDVMNIIQMVILTIVVLILSIFVIRPLISISSKPLQLEPARMDGTDDDITGDPNKGATADLQVVAQPNDDLLPPLGSGGGFGDSLPSLQELPMLSNFSGDMEGADASERLKSMIGERQGETVEIIRNWLEEREATG